MRVIAGDGEALELKGFAVLPVALCFIFAWHEFGVVPNFPLEVLVGTDVLAFYLCSLLYLKDNKKNHSNLAFKYVFGVSNIVPIPKSDLKSS